VIDEATANSFHVLRSEVGSLAAGVGEPVRQKGSSFVFQAVKVRISDLASCMLVAFTEVRSFVPGVAKRLPVTRFQQISDEFLHGIINTELCI
jgi:hypothetical protein